MRSGQAEPTGELKLVNTGHIRWVRDADCTLIVNHSTRQVLRLTDSVAAVWDWLNLGYSFIKTTRLLALAETIPDAEAEQILLALLDEWQALGLVTCHPLSGGSEGSRG